MDREQLRTLAAIVDEGSFEEAAAALGLTPSAVSQRIKALERNVGQPVVRRTLPPTPTPAGEVLLRLARQEAVLEMEARDALGLGATDRLALSVAVNADTLATWFAGVLAEVATWTDVTLRVRVDDQDHTRELLRAGEVVAGITSDPTPVSGCHSTPLGAMRYLPVAAPALADAFGSGRDVAWSAMPMVRFNLKDDLQHRFLRRRGASPGPTHEVPASDGFVGAVEAGLGWGMVPEAQLPGRALVRLADGFEDVPLHWQAWRMTSPRVSRLERAVVAAAVAGLRAPLVTSDG